MIVVPLIERKRDGGALSPEEWSALVAEYTAGRIPDYQIAALLMAVFMRGLERQELAALTDAMLASGDRLSFDGGASKCRGSTNTRRAVSATKSRSCSVPSWRPAALRCR